MGEKLHIFTLSAGKIAVVGADRLFSLDEADIPWDIERCQRMLYFPHQAPHVRRILGTTASKITLVGGSSADGVPLPVFFIVGSASAPEEGFKAMEWKSMVNYGHGVVEASAVSNRSGGMTNDVFAYYFNNVLAPALRDKLGQGVIITYDGAQVHISNAQVFTKLPAGLHILLRPPNTSSFLQVEDLGLYSFLKGRRHGELGAVIARVREMYGDDVNLNACVRMTTACLALEKAMTVEHNLTGWRRAGVVPFDPVQVLHGKDYRRVQRDPTEVSLFTLTNDHAVWMAQAKELPPAEILGAGMRASDIWRLDLADAKVQRMFQMRLNVQQAERQRRAQRRESKRLAASGAASGANITVPVADGVASSPQAQLEQQLLLQTWKRAEKTRRMQNQHELAKSIWNKLKASGFSTEHVVYFKKPELFAVLRWGPRAWQKYAPTGGQSASKAAMADALMHALQFEPNAVPPWALADAEEAGEEEQK